MEIRKLESNKPFSDTIEESLAGYVDDLKTILSLIDSNDDDKNDQGYTELNEYGLSFTYEGSQLVWLMGCGGPHVEFQILYDNMFEITAIYFFRSWIAWERINLKGDDFNIVNRAIEMEVDVPTFIKQHIV